jgi:hypothetical protein
MSNQNYSTGRYGVVDVFHRNIWMNHEDESIAHEIRKTFSSKVGLLVYDLSIFKNFKEDPPMIDSNCCLNWQIDFDLDDLSTKISIVTGANKKTQVSHCNLILINSKTEMLLSESRQLELQKQMMLYAQILKETKIHQLISRNDIREYQSRLFFDTDVDYNKIQSNLYQELNSIFSKELYTVDIKNQLRNLANRCLTVPTVFAASVAIEILSATGGIYA